jgi:hypothetical protein
VTPVLLIWRSTSKIESTMRGASPSDGSSSSSSSGFGHQGSPDRQHLLFSARQCPGALVSAFLQTPARAPFPVSAKPEVLSDRQFGEQPAALGNVDDAGIHDIPSRLTWGRYLPKQLPTLASALLR